ncbi:MAG TPA: type II toxin-antitoxin system RelE/ParE family toxin [Longimicrobium sp.]|nr:type II toxin-antitoxin system RelE/ParE family toxin [Longimicrobium sp.]
MTSYEVIVQPRAEREIRERHRFLATTAPAAAERWLSGILSLEEMPERCALAPEAPHVRRRVRQLLYEEHRILFVITGRHVRVLTVRHMKRRPLRRKPPN